VRRPIGIAAFVLALATLVILLLALRQGISLRFPRTVILNWPRIAAGQPGHVYRGSGSLSAKGVREVVVQAPTVGDVQLTAAPASDVSWQWSATGPRHGVLQSSVEGGVLTLTFTPATPLQWTFGGMPDKLQVRLPSGLDASVSVTTGASDIAGSYRSLTADVTTGALRLHDFKGQLTADVVTGLVNAQVLRCDGPLSVQVGTGSLTYQGDPGLSSSFTVGTGTASLAIAPRGTLRVQATAHMGVMNSGFPGLSGGSNGVHSGTVGQGPSGTLTVDDGTGTVSISPQ